MVSPAYPNDLTQEIDRRWLRRVKNRSTPDTHDNKYDVGGHCQSCHKLGPIAPVASEYRGDGVIHHYWRCNACSHEWMTAQAVSV